MSSFFQDALDTVSGAAREIGGAVVGGVTDITKTNIANAVKNATDKKIIKNSTEPNALAPITTGVNPDGSTVTAGARAAAAAASIPTWALVLGGISIIALTVGVVVMVKS